MPAYCNQFPLQNAFALTVHKTQGLTIFNVSVSIDKQMFAYGQAYVALSRAPSWNSLDITAFDPNSVKTDLAVIAKYNCLTSMHNN
ncbi:27412_t:CDS:1, partial [Racocetra persica]